jgi:hypothetical protein
MTYPRTQMASAQQKLSDERAVIDVNFAKATWRDVVELTDTDMPYTVVDVSSGVANDCFIVDTDPTGTYTVTLPTLADNVGRTLMFINVGSSGNDVTIEGEATGENIDGAADKAISDGETLLLVATTSYGWRSLPLGV